MRTRSSIFDTRPAWRKAVRSVSAPASARAALMGQTNLCTARLSWASPLSCPGARPPATQKRAA
eukprot:9208622-Alexandrium_andersonii.AAC.1